MISQQGSHVLLPCLNAREGRVNEEVQALCYSNIALGGTGF